MVAGSDDSGRSFIMQFFDAAHRGESDERFQGRENALTALQSQDEPQTVKRTPCDRDWGWVVMVPLLYRDDFRQCVGVVEPDCGRIKASAEQTTSPVVPKPAWARFAESQPA